MEAPVAGMKLDSVTQKYVENHPHDCSHILVRWWQVAFYLVLAICALALLIYRWDVLLVIVNSALAFVYFCVIAFRMVAGVLSFMGYGQIRVSDDELTALRDEDLPVYTILVPLYKEACIADKIIHRIDALDYPKEKLDVKLLLEEDDVETVNAMRALNLPDYYDVIVVPDAQPKTKPKACNHGLKRARGEYCVIFDAEDRPEPDQLKKVVVGFAHQPKDVACIQAKLNYYNTRQNLLTRWFTIEYSTAFDLFLPGLQIMRVPVPLGGTSNHFRTEILRELGGWDPFNVTEDCDLGVRIYKHKYRTRMIDSTTWEEANSKVWNWVRQRSRWTKGFFQTHLAHMRNPFRTFAQLGPWGFFGFLLCVGGSSLMFVLNVFYWIVATAYGILVVHAMLHGVPFIKAIAQHGSEVVEKPVAIMLRGHTIRVWPLLYYGPDQDQLWSSISIIFFTISAVLLLANVLFVILHVAACIERRRYELIPIALTMPIYWVLISIGAWKGFLQLFTNPFYWEKTDHGLDIDDPEAVAAEE